MPDLIWHPGPPDEEDEKMQSYAEMSKEELQALRKKLSAQYKEFQGKDLKLDMSRGKPSAEQLDLSMEMMNVLNSDSDLTCEDGTDCRNYGVLTGIKEVKELIGDMMEVSPDNIPFDDTRRNGLYSVVQARQSKIPLPGSGL